jgi:hypothetical protein
MMSPSSRWIFSKNSHVSLFTQNSI